MTDNLCKDLESGIDRILADAPKDLTKFQRADVSKIQSLTKLQKEKDKPIDQKIEDLLTRLGL